MTEEIEVVRMMKAADAQMETTVRWRNAYGLCLLFTSGAGLWFRFFDASPALFFVSLVPLLGTGIAAVVHGQRMRRSMGLYADALQRSAAEGTGSTSGER